MTQAPTLRPYQATANEAVCDAMERGHNRLLVQMSTGLGKTVAFSALPTWPRLAAWLQTFPKNEQKTLVIAHRDELIEQAAAKLQAANPGAVISVEQADRVAHKYSDIVVASIQTLTMRKCARLKRLLDQHVFRIVIYDECQHASSPSARTALVHLGFLPPADASDVESLDAPSYADVETMEDALKAWNDVAPKDRLLVGYTATPNRSDGIGLGAVFEEIVFSYGVRAGIQDGWLVPIIPWAVDTDTNLDGVHTAHGEFNQRELEDAVNTSQRNKLAVAAWQEHAAGRSTLAFTVGVKHAHEMADAFRKAGITARAVSGETPKEERKATLAAYTRGEIQVLTNAMVFTEGTDLPRTSCILNAKPTKSATLFTQLVGRGLRILPPDKTDCVLIDLVDVARRHSLQAAPVLYGLPPGIKTQGEDLETLREELGLFTEKYPTFDVEAALAGERLTLKQLRAKAETFDIWTVPPLGALTESTSLNWIRAGDIYRVSYPWTSSVGEESSEVVTVEPDMLGHFSVVATLRPKWTDTTQPRPATRQRTVAAQLPTAAAALTLAEAFIQQERPQAMRMKDRAAGWRGQPASEKQLRFLAQKGVPHNPKTVTKGEASDLLDLAFARGGAKGGKKTA